MLILSFNHQELQENEYLNTLNSHLYGQMKNKSPPTPPPSRHVCHQIYFFEPIIKTIYMAKYFHVGYCAVFAVSLFVPVSCSRYDYQNCESACSVCLCGKMWSCTLAAAKSTKLL